MCGFGGRSRGGGGLRSPLLLQLQLQLRLLLELLQLLQRRLPLPRLRGLRHGPGGGLRRRDKQLLRLRLQRLLQLLLHLRQLLQLLLLHLQLGHHRRNDAGPRPQKNQIPESVQHVGGCPCALDVQVDLEIVSGASGRMVLIVMRQSRHLLAVPRWCCSRGHLSTLGVALSLDPSPGGVPGLLKAHRGHSRHQHDLVANGMQDVGPAEGAIAVHLDLEPLADSAPGQVREVVRQLRHEFALRTWGQACGHKGTCRVSLRTDEPARYQIGLVKLHLQTHTCRSGQRRSASSRGHCGVGAARGRCN
mmetsp:Transcript_17985/g.49361  ORF Transcript_17985/g.49361 Transcript_17985/m.49361 type:complete len:304 (+) Transcript_17985:234-1145(+)